MADRLFTALWPAEATRRELLAALEPIRPNASDVHWQPPHRWHITLAYLGPADPGKACSRIARLAAAGSLPAAEPIRPVGSGSFGNALWIGAETGPWLDHLAARLQGALRTEDRRFRAHLTVGRTRGPSSPRRARQAAALLGTYAGSAWTPHEFTLVRSLTGPTPQYDVLAAWPLPAPEGAAPDASPPT